MEWISFIREYMRMPRFVGAIVPSSKYLANKMIENIDFRQARYIVEYGPGTGVFTDMLLSHRKPETVILLVEYNQEFYDILKSKYRHEPNMHIIHDSAEHIDKYLIRHGITKVDYFVSGLPFASLPESVSSAILSKTRQYLQQDGKFITFQYTLLKKDLMKQFFGNIKVKREVRNLPPAYVFCCSRQSPNNESKM